MEHGRTFEAMFLNTIMILLMVLRGLNFDFVHSVGSC
jgi:hypothetical protein